MKELGAFGEAYAVGILSRRGYAIVARNVRFRVGEIDIVARDGAELVFVEVKCRRTGRYGTPEDSITPRRFARLARAIQTYLQQSGQEETPHRVDVVSIEVGGDGRVRRCDLLRGVEAPV